ncbi:hypothetical protein HK405_004393, partial [Cladochytrium tenue]
MKVLAEDVPVSSDLIPEEERSPASSAFQGLLNLICLVHRDREDFGLCFWTDIDLRKFLKYILDVKSVPLLKLALLVLANLSAGPNSAELAAQFFSTENPRLSWTSFFQSLSMSAKGLAAYPDRELHPDELALQQGFLSFLTQVARYSRPARITLYANPNFQAVNTLFSLLNRRVPVDMKASLFESIASFCVPDEAGSNTSNIAPAVWWHLEQAEVVPTSGGGQKFSSFGGQQKVVRMNGIRFDLEQIESQNQTYPETMAFLTLLNVLILGWKSSYLATQAGHAPGENQAAGLGYDNSIVTKYVEFVIEDIFMKAHNRSYSSMTERWRMLASCLHIVDQCVKSFDIQFITSRYANLTADQEAQILTSSTLKELASHPGFAIVARVLCGSPMLKRILEIIANGVENVNTFGANNPPFVACVKLALNIILQILNLQSFFLDLEALDVGRQLGLPTSLTGLDQLLAFYKDVVVSIALFVNCTVDDEICLLSVKIINRLAQSPVFRVVDLTSKNVRTNRLVSLFTSSAECLQIAAGYVQRLEVEEPEQLADSPSNELENNDVPDALNAVFSGFSKQPLEVPGICNVIRLSILDLLVSNVAVPGSFPTLSHYLLGYNIKKVPPYVEIEDETVAGRQYCLHVILRLLRRGVSPIMPKRDGVDSGAVEEPLYLSYPKLSEKCYHLIYRICADPATSSATMRFLRTTEDFFRCQLESMPGHFVGNTGNHDQMISQIHQRAWLLKSIGLELQLASLGGQRSQCQKLLTGLFVSVSPNSKSVEFEQSLTKMLDILNSFDFDTTGKLDTLPTNLIHKSELKNCIRKDEYGRLLYDLRAVYSILVEKQRLYEQQSAVVSAEERDKIYGEVASLMKHVFELNQRIVEFGAWLHCIEAWCGVTRIAFGRCFDALSPLGREEMVYNILAAIFAKLRASKASIEVAEAVSYVVLQLVKQIRSDKVYQAILRSSSLSAGGSARSMNTQGKLPVDCLLDVILKGILDLLVTPDSTAQMRSNMYASLLDYLIYTGSDDTDFMESTEPSHLATAAGLDAVLRDGGERPTASSSAYRSSLFVGNYAMIKKYGDRLLETVCSDASRGRGLQQIVAYGALDAVYSLPSQDPQNRVLAFLVRRNFLGDFVGGVRWDDEGLQSVLRSSEQTTDAWRSKFALEAKLAFFIKLTKSREGIEGLFNAGILDVLTNLRFIEERPDRAYNELLGLVLKLISSILVHGGKDNASVTKKVTEFVIAHIDTFFTIMRERAGVE